MEKMEKKEMSNQKKKIVLYEIVCPTHGKVENHSSGYPPFERIDCPVEGCNFWRLVR